MPARKFKNRVLIYEKSPPLTGYAKTALLLGFDTQACGDTDGETFQEDYIRTPFIPGTWSVDTEADIVYFLMDDGMLDVVDTATEWDMLWEEDAAARPRHGLDEVERPALPVVPAI